MKGAREELGTNHIPTSETRLVPGAFGDPFRIVEALPGMAPWLSGLPYFYVRGAPPESVGYSIDGIRVPLLFHVGAGPSSIAPALVDSVDLFSGAYPAAFGRYAGAIIAGETTRPEDVDHVRGEVGARVFDAHAFAEAPLPGDGATVLAAARYSYTGLLTSLIVPDYKVGYWDYQFRASHRVAGRDMLSLFVFGSHDELTYRGAPTFHVDYHRADLRYDHPLPGGRLRVAATFSYDDTLTALQTNTGVGSTAALKGPGGRVRAELEERVSEGALVRAGADFGVERFDLDEYGIVEGAPNEGVVRPPHTDLEGGVHADVVWRPSRRVELVPGFRLDGYRTRGATAWAPQPRAAGRVEFARGWTWISAVGVAHQEPTEEVFVPARLPDPVVDESGGDSYQFSEAVEAKLAFSIRVRATAFYSSIVARHIDEEERSAGIELFARRDFTERLGGFVSYTLSRADALSSGPRRAVDPRRRRPAPPPLRRPRLRPRLRLAHRRPLLLRVRPPLPGRLPEPGLRRPARRKRRPRVRRHRVAPAVLPARRAPREEMDLPRRAMDLGHPRGLQRPRQGRADDRKLLAGRRPGRQQAERHHLAEHRPRQPEPVAPETGFGPTPLGAPGSLRRPVSWRRVNAEHPAAEDGAGDGQHDHRQDMTERHVERRRALAEWEMHDRPPGTRDGPERRARRPRAHRIPVPPHREEREEGTDRVGGARQSAVCMKLHLRRLVHDLEPREGQHVFQPQDRDREPGRHEGERRHDGDRDLARRRPAEHRATAGDAHPGREECNEQPDDLERDGEAQRPILRGHASVGDDVPQARSPRHGRLEPLLDERDERRRGEAQRDQRRTDFRGASARRAS